ncbi:hypothetical protein [Pyrococcus kukulkanii]|uniref:Nucleotidyltransferase n=1 Tax=Pyrococcus kukulkanii TaxID=1609559 RepID=A0ABV4T6P7_9EURY
MGKILRDLKAIIIEEFERREIKVREIIPFGSRAKGNIMSSGTVFIGGLIFRLT